MARKDSISLAEDDRAKIPFAVIGVLLLVTSVSIVVVLETRSEPEVDTDAAQSYDRTSSAVRSVIQGATTEALQNAAAQPVTVADTSTPVGRALADGPSSGNDPDEVFSRYVQLRVYLALQERLGHATQSIRQDTVTRVTMPEYDDPADAIDAITLQVGGDELDYGDPGGGDLPYGAVRVTVPDVRIEVVEDGFVAGNRTQDYTVTVGSSVFELHHRTSNYEAALNTDLGDQSGFARHFGARLYRVGWQRGHAQANGSAVAEVLADRHLRTLANDAVFATQRDAFGAEDPYADRMLTRSYACMLAEDRHAIYDDPTGGSADLGPVLDRVDEPGFCAGLDTIYADLSGGLEGATAPTYTSLAGQNDFLEGTERMDLDEASATTVGELEASDSISAAIDRIYTVEVGVEENLSEQVIPAGDDVEPPDGGWSVADSELLSVASYRIHELESERVLRANETGPEQSYYRYDVSLSLDVNRRITWRNGGRTLNTTGGAILLIHGTFTVTGHYSPDSEVADLGIVHDYTDGPYGSDGTIYDTNFEAVPGNAVEAIFPSVNDSTARDRQLRQYLTANADQVLSADDLIGTLTVPNATTRIHPEPDDRGELHGWLVRDLRRLERNTSTVSTVVTRRELLHNDSRLEPLYRQIAGDERVYAEVNGEHYLNVPDRLRAETRLQYMQALRSRVNATIAEHARETRRLDRILRDHSRIGVENATQFAREQLTGTPYAPSPPVGDEHALLEDVEIVPHGEPTYLTFDRVDASQVPAAGTPPNGVTPVAGREDNVFGTPSTDVTRGPGEVHIRTAGRVLRAARATEAIAATSNWDHGRTAALERSLAADVDAIVGEAARSASGPFPHISPVEMRRAIDRELGRRGPLPTQATELARGGDGVDTVAAEVARSFDRPDDLRYDYYGTDYYVHLETAVRHGLLDAMDNATLDGATASRTVRLRRHVRDELETEYGTAMAERRRQAATDGLTNRTGTRTSQEWLRSSPGDPAPNTVPSGAVVVDRPAMNVLTTNVWNVHLRGEYPRFVVTATADRRTGTSRVEYVRERGSVRLTFDGSEQIAGRTEALTFESNTSLLIAVPADSYGVGDRTTVTTWCSETYDVAGTIHDPSRIHPCARP